MDRNTTTLEDLQELAIIGLRHIREQSKKNIVCYLGQPPDDIQIRQAVAQLKIITNLDINEQIVP